MLGWLLKEHGFDLYPTQFRFIKFFPTNRLFFGLESLYIYYFPRSISSCKHTLTLIVFIYPSLQIISHTNICHGVIFTFQDISTIHINWKLYIFSICPIRLGEPQRDGPLDDRAMIVDGLWSIVVGWEKKIPRPNYMRIFYHPNSVLSLEEVS